MWKKWLHCTLKLISNPISGFLAAQCSSKRHLLAPMKSLFQCLLLSTATHYTPSRSSSNFSAIRQMIG
ncbi:hypothetical protein HHUSO_G5407 [Huso huso]|uniref:Secreted protein n=1 Tax=Huso huso TaxID=61971 RepID=A0ABR1A0Y9_HUSHU